MRVYIGNLPYDFGSEDLRRLFREFGEIESAEVVLDFHTGLSRGFAFVRMASDSEARKAIAELNGLRLTGRSLAVREANPPKARYAVPAQFKAEEKRRSDSWYGGKSW